MKQKRKANNVKIISLLLSSFLFTACAGEKVNVFVLRNKQDRAYVYVVNGINKRTGEFNLTDGPILSLQDPRLDGSVCAPPKNYAYLNFLWKRYYAEQIKK